MTSRVLSLGALALFLSACGSSTGSGQGAPDGSSSDTGKTAPTDAGRVDSGPGHVDSGPGHLDGGPAHLDSGPADASVSDASSADGAVDASMVAPFDATGFEPLDAGRSPLTGLTTEAWTWVPFPDSKCRDGSSTGIGVNVNPASTKLMVFLEGGGACFNDLTCGSNPSSFDGSDFSQRFPSTSDGGAPASGDGIFDRVASNPVGDWSFVYVPYCTGDIHAGNNPNGSVPMVAGIQAFVGYQNVEVFLQRIVPTFSSATQVLLTGASGGGFGAAANYVHVQRAFGTIPVDMIDDSGPFMEDPYLPVCLQNEVRALWGVDQTVGADCNGHCNNPQAFFLDFAKYVTTAYPTRTFGLLDSVDDGTITAFFGFGADDCTSFDPETEATFSGGLDDIRTQTPETNLGTFYFAGSDHTSFEDGSYYTRTTSSLTDGGTVALTSWVGAVVGGSPFNAGP